jgi:large subunit ribosomal protein L1
MAKKGKRYTKAMQLLEGVELPLSLSKGIDLARQTATAKFDESIRIDVRLGVDPRHADQMVRGSVMLPHGTGKTLRVLVLTNEGKQPEATAAGADFVGLEEYITKIQGGWTDVEVVIATPDVMSQLGKIARILGPRGLMPSPRTGTVTNDIAAAVQAAKAGKIDFRVDKFGNLHTAIGKSSFDASKLQENAEAFLREVVRLRPSSAKGTYVRSVTVSSTMGPGIAVDRNEVVNTIR